MPVQRYEVVDVAQIAEWSVLTEAGVRSLLRRHGISAVAKRGTGRTARDVYRSSEVHAAMATSRTRWTADLPASPFVA